tara:strand:+ start:33802 stop:36252 length:2451 start_codon:yes stop_codon:yes gene_type:complete
MELLDAAIGFLSAWGIYGLLASVLLVLVVGYLGLPFIAWTVVLAFILIGYAAPTWLLLLFLVVAVIGNIKPLRQILISSPLMKFMRRIIPEISETEKQALDAGKVWLEAEFFSGKPNFKKMRSVDFAKLTDEEQSFLDNQVKHLCSIVNDFEVHRNRALPQEVWDYIKKEKFFGLIIPKEYGGLGFSPLMNSAVVKMVSSRSVPLATNIMVPNSLGPAELLIHYGTEEQKKYYLPRLASAEEIPCFALTEPNAGSDAGSISSSGVLFKGEDGKLYIRLNWNKRYITMAAISTVLGLAFKLRDPDKLLGGEEDLGITCALIPTKTEGVIVGRRHDPLNCPFYNCPTQGKDVVVPIDAVIGGEGGLGKGWGMLMESLAAGRGISLPAQASGGVLVSAYGASAHATIRKQFGINIGRFEGIEEPLARLAARAYLIESQRYLTCSGLNAGEQPPVVTAICKYTSTEMMRAALNDAMDILAGNGISRGPRNFISNGYTAAPVAITVEGANILTRTLIVFGQGALRGHPYAYKEVSAVEAGDKKAFDYNFWGHVGHVVRNLFRAVVLSWTRGWAASSPVSGPTAKYYRKITWATAVFAFMTDVAMGSLGGALKQKGKLTGRFADILSMLYYSFAVLYRYEQEGSKREDLPYVEISMQYAFSIIQESIDGIYENLKVPGLSWFFAGPVRFFSGMNPYNRGITDETSHKVAQLMQEDNEQRKRLLEDGIYVPEDGKGLGLFANAFKAIKASADIEKKIRRAMRKKEMPKIKGPAALDKALELGVITQAEFEQVQAAEALRNDAIQVDDFSPEEYFHQPEVAHGR